jgi:hypothetical protein
MVKKKLRISFLALVSFCTMHARYGRLMIFIDQGEPRAYNQIGIPVAMAFIQALYEKTGPILINAYAWNNILDRFQAYTHLMKVPSLGAEIYDALCQTVADCIQKELATIPDKDKKNLSAVAMKLQKMVSHKLNQDEAFLKKSESFAQGNDFWTASFNGTIFRVISKLDPSQWHIYSFDDAWYLFVPRHYQQNMKKEYDAEIAALFPTFKRSIPSARDAMTGRNLEKDEMALGLKLHNFEKVTLSQWGDFFWKKPVFELKEGMLVQSTTIENLLSRLFVTYDDMSDKTIASTVLPHHIIYLDGHGGYAPGIVMEELMGALEESAELQRDIGFFTQGQMNNFPEDKREKIIQLMELEEEITVMMNSSNGIIAGLSMTAYKQLLDFLNDKISTTMLYYYSCFGGGQQLQLPFFLRGIDKIYNYTIMSEISADIPGYGDQPYFYARANAALNVFYENNKVMAQFALSSQINYALFFYAVEKKLPLSIMMSYIVHNEKTNIPAIRLPGTSWFSVARLKDVAYITNVALSMTKNFDVSGKKAVLLYTPAIFSDITMNIPIMFYESSFAAAQYQAKYQLPLFISMSSEGQVHWIQSLQACDCCLTAVIYNFLKELAIGEMRVHKRYLIDTLCVQNNLGQKASKLLGVTQGQTMILTDVLIYNGYIPKLRLKQGLFFTWNKKGYIAKYIVREKRISEPINPEQDIQELTPKQFEFYQKMYQDLKGQAQKIAKPLIDTRKLEEFTRKHKKKPVFMGRDIFAPEIQEKPAFGGRDIFAPDIEEDEPSE